MTKCALRLAPLVFVRPGELRRAQWPEIDLDEAEWRITASKAVGLNLHLELNMPVNGSSLPNVLQQPGIEEEGFRLVAHSIRTHPP